MSTVKRIKIFEVILMTPSEKTNFSYVFLYQPADRKQEFHILFSFSLEIITCNIFNFLHPVYSKIICPLNFLLNLELLFS